MAEQVLQLTRDQLAKFLGNDRNAILVFEALLNRTETALDVPAGGTGNISFPQGSLLIGNGVLALLSILTTPNQVLFGAGAAGIDDDPGFTRTGVSGRYLIGATDDGVGKVQINGDLKVIGDIYNDGSSVEIASTGLTLVASTNIGTGGGISLVAGGGTDAGDILINGVNGSVSGSSVLIVTGNGPSDGILTVTDVAGSGILTYEPADDLLSVGSLKLLNGPLTIPEQSAPASPGVGEVVIYAKTDGSVYSKNNAGTESPLGGIVLVPAQATTSGTSVDFTGIPAEVNEICVHFLGVGSSGSSIPIIQIGDSGGIETSTYLGSVANLPSGASPVVANNNSGFLLAAGWASTVRIQGTAFLRRAAGNTWTYTLALGRSDGTFALTGGGVKTLSDILTTVRLTTVGGADTFTAGSVSLSYF